MIAYYDIGHKLLYSGFSEKPYARYSVNPAFRPEYAFSVEKINGEYYVISNIFSEYYWYALVENRQGSVKLHSKKTEINEELYLKIRELFEILIAQTKEKERIFKVGPNGELYEIVEFGADGETYTFSITDKNGEVKSGKTWSPHPSNKPILSRLIKICDDLWNIENSISQTNILKEIEILICDIQRNVD